MFSQVTDLMNGLMWTRGGTVWAMWRLEGIAYGFRPDAMKDEIRAMHTSLLRGLRGEGLLLSTVVSADPADAVRAMVAGVDLDEHPDWVAECEATLDMLESYDLGDRVYWLAVPLRNDGVRAFLEPIRAGFATIKDRLAMPRCAPGVTQLSARQRQAESIRKDLPPSFRARPATVAEIAWVHLHAQQRGLHMDAPIPTPDGAAPLNLAAASMLPAPLIDPCATADLPPRRPLTPVDVLKRRYLKITGIESGEASYQTCMVVSATPPGGVAFPGGEWLGRIDECGMSVDYAWRLTVRSREEASAKNRRSKANLADQLVQRADDTGGAGLGELALAEQDLDEYQGTLDLDQMEVEVEVTTIFAVGAPTAEEVVDAARELARHFKGYEFRVVADPSAQEALWWAMMPGAPTTRVVRQYGQITTAANLAAAVPLTTAEIGDDEGSCVGLEIGSGRVNVVLLDIAAAALADASPAVAIVGELGAGKSLLMKKLALDAVARGALLTVIDRTTTAEWADAVGAVAESIVVDISERAAWSIDPLRVFPTVTAGRIAQSFLSALLNVSAMDEYGVVLNEVLAPEYLKLHRIAGMGQLMEHLASLDDPAARFLARKMSVIASKDFGAAVFDLSLPPVDVTVPALVFLTGLTQLPDPEELSIPHLFAQLPLEKVFGRAAYALLTAIARQRSFADRSRLGVFAVDEAWAVTSSPEGLAEVLTFVREGRRSKASLIIGSHDPFNDFPDEVLRGLIKCRVLMRHTDETLARRGLAFVFGQPADAPVSRDLVDLITTQTSPRVGRTVPPERRGECLLRDFRGRVGRVKVLLPAQPERARLVQTTPGESRAAA